MHNANSRMVRAVMDQRLDEAARSAQSRRMREQAGVIGSGWLAQRRCQMLSQLGGLLVATGEKLEQYSSPQSQPAQG